MKFAFVFSTLSMFLIYACSSVPKFTSAGTDAKVKPEIVNGKNAAGNGENYPGFSKSNSLETDEGTASYYAKEFNGNFTSNGEIFDMYKMTAAHHTFPFNTIVKVTNLNNNKSVIVRINDRMPPYNRRIIDLSYEAAKKLDMLSAGTAKVKLEVLTWGGSEDKTK